MSMMQLLVSVAAFFNTCPEVYGCSWIQSSYMMQRDQALVWMTPPGAWLPACAAQQWLVAHALAFGFAQVGLSGLRLFHAHQQHCSSEVHMSG
jgi:hypothetical protein